jgi:hypothetical protein
MRLPSDKTVRSIAVMRILENGSRLVMLLPMLAGAGAHLSVFDIGLSKSQGVPHLKHLYC